MNPSEELTMPDAIWIPCEGSGYPVNLRNYCYGSCAMCGRWLAIVEPDGVAIRHERQDILAMIDRGDFETDDA